MKTHPANVVLAEAILGALKAATEAADTAVREYRQEAPPQHRTLQQQGHARGLYYTYSALAGERQRAWERLQILLGIPVEK
jgi:hypothetical protein